MSKAITGHTRPTKPKRAAARQKRKRADVDLETLQEAVAALDPKNAEIKTFDDLPLSEETREGLLACNFKTVTDIQARAIVPALQGRDILGAAKTGSGKTLAFLIPVLENLYRDQLIGSDAGLGALIVAPTRELAVQIFQVLRKLGQHGHMFAAGLVTGGKSLQEERDALARMNIVVCTPGRILQHLSQTAGFVMDVLRILVLDEADRILDMGFQRDVDAIIEYLPPDRQTLLFSATQTQRVSDLARLSLRDPEYISVHETASTATPQGLVQNYVVTPLPSKLDTLWSFLQSTKRAKIIVFFSTGKQVRFVYESFRHMRPGIPLLHLHGRQKQTARLDITTRFAAMPHVCLLATDVAARGLDFPAVDWVVQVDCPEDADTYIHRAGRTARYEREGRAVLFLAPSEEEGMLERLTAKRVPIERIAIRAKKQTSIQSKLQSMLFQDPQLKYLGQKAFITYVKSVYVQKDKNIFDLQALPLEEYADSLGLPGAPKIRFLKGDQMAVKARKNAPRELRDVSDDEDDEGSEESGAEEPRRRKAADTTTTTAVRTKYDRMFERKNQDVLTDHYAGVYGHDDTNGAETTNGVPKRTLAVNDDDNDDDDLFDVKRRIPAEISNNTKSHSQEKRSDAGPKTVHIYGTTAPLLLDSKRREKMLTSKRQLTKLKTKGERLVFDDDGVAHPLYELEDATDFAARSDATAQRQAFVDTEQAMLAEADVDDKAIAREKRREKKAKRKRRERDEAAAAAEESDAGSGDGEGSGGVPLLVANPNAFADFLADAEELDD